MGMLPRKKTPRKLRVLLHTQSASSVPLEQSADVCVDAIDGRADWYGAAVAGKVLAQDAVYTKETFVMCVIQADLSRQW